MSTITITFAVRESKSRTSGEAPIQVLLTQNGARASFSTGKAVQPSEWDRDRQRVKGRDTEAAEINNYLDAIRARLYNLEKVLIDRGLCATPQMLRDAYLDKLDCLKDWTLMTLIEIHLNELRSKIGKSIAKPSFHRIIHQASPIFDRKKLSFIFPNGVIEKVKLDRHLNCK